MVSDSPETLGRIQLLVSTKQRQGNWCLVPQLRVQPQESSRLTKSSEMTKEVFINKIGSVTSLL